MLYMPHSNLQGAMLLLKLDDIPLITRLCQPQQTAEAAFHELSMGSAHWRMEALSIMPRTRFLEQGS